MTPEEFKQWGYRFVDWVADYLSHPERHAVLSKVKPGDIRKQLPQAPPEAPESFELDPPGSRPDHRSRPDALESSVVPRVLPDYRIGTRDFRRNGHGCVQRQRDAVADGAGRDGARGARSGLAASDDRAAGFLQGDDLRHGFNVDISRARGCARRCRGISGRSVRDDGICGPGAPVLRIYASEQAHSSVEKSAMALGIGRRGLAKIGTDSEFRMDVRRAGVRD